MAGNFDRHIRSERRSTGFVVAKMAIKGRERRARADDAKVDGSTARFAKAIFSRIHHFAAKPSSLPQGIHAKQPQVTSITVNLDVDATGQANGIFSDKEFPFGHVGANAVGVDAVALDVRLLDSEGGIDQANERIHIGAGGRTNVNTLRRTSIGGIGHKREFCLLKMLHSELV